MENMNFPFSFPRGTFADPLHTVAYVAAWLGYILQLMRPKPRNVQEYGYLGFFQAIQSSSNSCLPEATPSFSRIRDTSMETGSRLNC